MQDIAFLFIGAAFGAAIAWIYQRSASASFRATHRAFEAQLVELQSRASRVEVEARGRVEAETQARIHQTRLTEMADQLRAKEVEAQQAVQRESELSSRLARAETSLSKSQEAHDEKLRLLLTAREELGASFKAAAADALKQSGEQFLQQATTAFDGFHKAAQFSLEARQAAVEVMINPLVGALVEMDDKVVALEKSRAEAYGQLGEQLRGLGEAQARLYTETTKLSTALRSSSTRGRWGEVQLRRLIEAAGMVSYCDFQEQANTVGEEGRQRPDLVVNLPGGRVVVVDSKVPLSAFLDAADCEDEQGRVAKLREHAAQIHRHAAALGQKAYWERHAGSPAFVVMFLAGESFLSEALRHTPDLIEKCFQHNVVVATPATLLALLRTVAQGWQQERIAENAEEVRKLGRDLYERLCTMGEHVEQVGVGLRRALDSYNDAVGSLERRVFPAARRFRDLGVDSTKELREIPASDVTVRSVQVDELIRSSA